MSISQMIQCMKQNKDPSHLLISYRGKDWESIVRYHSPSLLYPKHIVLCKTNSMKLVLTGWHKDQYTDYYTNYSVLHTLLVKGSMFHSTNSKDKIAGRFVSRMYLYTPPHTKLELSSFQTSCTLQLQQFSYLY
jgi:hypothetical protein